LAVPPAIHHFETIKGVRFETRHSPSAPNALPRLGKNLGKISRFAATGIALAFV